MNSKANAPKDRKEEKRGIQSQKLGKTNNTLDKNYQNKSKNEKLPEEKIYERIFNDLIEKKLLLSKEI